ncbi:MAG: phosphate transport system regulatory protein PhoU, partial [Clostridiales bacterium]|nr:phosphate transport system regulatory protein PhoU [Clostridiales bacterium]
ATSKMVTRSIDSYVKQDLNIAKDVIHDDDVVDDLFVKVKNGLIAILTQQDVDPGLSECCVDMLMIAKYFERIGDHAVNIAEWVEYAITGSHVD